MQKYFANRKQSLELKAIGFNEPCCAIFRDDNFKFPVKVHNDPNGLTNSFQELSCDVTAPLKSQVFDFFREEHRLNVEILTNFGDVTNNTFRGTIKNMDKMFKDYTNHKYITGATYEEAESNLIDKLIEIIKKQIPHKNEKISRDFY